MHVLQPFSLWPTSTITWFNTLGSRGGKMEGYMQFQQNYGINQPDVQWYVLVKLEYQRLDGFNLHFPSPGTYFSILFFDVVCKTVHEKMRNFKVLLYDHSTPGGQICSFVLGKVSYVPDVSCYLFRLEIWSTNLTCLKTNVSFSLLAKCGTFQPKRKKIPATRRGLQEVCSKLLSSRSI